VTTWYVDTGSLLASDSNTGTSPAAPFKTIGRANNVAATGDTVIVKAGTYPESTTLKTDGVTWTAEPGVVIDVTGLGNGFTLPALNNVTIEGFKVQGSASGYGIAVQGGGGHKIRYNRVTGCISGGIRMQPQSPQLFTPTDAGAGGSLPAGTQYYAVSAIIGGQETLPSFVLGVTIPAAHLVQLQWSKVPAASSFNIYGRTQTGATKITNIANSFGSGFPTWVDDGSLAPDAVTVLPIVSGVLMGECLVEGNEVYANGSHGIYLFGANSVRVRGNDCHHNALHGIALLNASNDNTVEFNRSYNNSNGSRTANGIQCDRFGVGSPGSARNLIQFNACFKNDDSGISIYNGSNDCIVRRNLCYANGDHGIDNFNATGCHMIGNTVVGNVAAGLNSEGGSTGIRMFNNLAVDNGVSSPRTSGNYRLDPSVVSDAQFDYNTTRLTVPADQQPPISGRSNAEIVWGTTLYPSLAAFQAAHPTQMGHGTTGDPLFLAPADGDFSTLPGSSARQAGSGTAPDVQERDFVGRLSSVPPDCGAFQS